MREQHIHVIRFRGTYDSGTHFGCKIILEIDLLRRTLQTQNQIVHADHIPDHVILFYSADNAERKKLHFFERDLLPNKSNCDIID